MDWDAFHARAVAARPTEDIPPKRYLIGVLLLGRSLQQPLSEFDFVWMKAHAKIPIETIRAKFTERYPDTDFDLLLRGEVVPSGTLAKTMNHYEDGMVILQATVRQRPTPIRAGPSLPGAIPLQTIHRPAPQLPCAGQQGPSAEEAKVVNAALPLLTPISTNKENTVPSWDMPSVETPHRLSSHPVSSWHRESTSPLSNPPQSLRPPSSASGNGAAGPHNPRPNTVSENTSRFTVPPVSQSVHSTPTLAVKPERYSPPPFHNPPPETALTFNPEDAFKIEPSPEADDAVSEKPTVRFIREIIEQQTPEILEAGVAKSMEVLEALKNTFLQYTNSCPDASAWIEAIDKLKTQSERSRTVVGVVGNTGAGKSSVINALLEEERLVPTNCMRACTAVVTELSWNDCTDLGSKYRAEIEFIGRSDWEKELGILLKEFLTENGTVVREVSDQGSDAGIAWAKFRAVYPKITKDMLGSCTVEKLMAEQSVLSVLGTTKRINQARPGRFYTELQKYVDSKEKVTGKDDKKDKDQTKKSRSLEYWPLIKVVKIYTKSSALSTGAVIVDLPGVHDSNAARAAVADRYMKQCTGLWIVAPINRAVDDKAAKTLLGESFKRQLKYDGNYSSVTFICSKTDDISITEATESLELEDQMSHLEDQQCSYEQKIKSVEEQIEGLKESADVYRAVIHEADDDIETWEDLKDRCDDGAIVFAPVPEKPNKRKRGISNKKRSRKRLQTEGDDSDIEIISSDSDMPSDSDGDSDLEGIQAPQEPLTQEKIKRKLEELRSMRKNAREEKARVRKQIQEIKPEIAEFNAKLEEIRAEMSGICISGRNEYSKAAIQQDFAAGIKELDQENAADDNDANFNPDEDLRDYEEVARSLPVFCVSSRAYQKMCGHLQKDDDVPGFKTAEETEMPQLQAHCKKLTEAGRVQTSRTFLLALCQQLTTFSLWASNDGTGLNMTDEDKRKQLSYIQKRLEHLQAGLEGAVEACLRVMKKSLKDQIFDRYPELINDAIKVAPDTAHGWGRKPPDGGLHWGTYKAVCRRGGAYHSAVAGHRDFNADLIDPIVKKLATGWERTFQKRLPNAFETYAKDSGKVLHAFHQKIEERARQNGVGLANLAMLKGSIYTYEQMFQDLGTQLLAAMNEIQKDANRDFVPTIAIIMDTAYTLCTDERGPGSFMRMKSHMLSYIENHRDKMFKSATETVHRHLGDMCKSLEEKMSDRSDEIFAMMRSDYLRVLGGVQVSQDVMSKEERRMRKEIMTLLGETDSQFERVVSGELDEKQRGNEEDDSADDEVDKPPELDVDAESVAESTNGSPFDDTMNDVNDDTVITEPSPSKPSDDVNMQAACTNLNQAFVEDAADEEL